VTIRRVLIGLFIVAFAVAGWGIAQDEPPVRLKKKDKPPAVKEEPAKPAEKEEPARPAAEDKKPEDRIKEEKIKKDDDPPEVGDEPEMDPQEVLSRALKNSRTVEERLANKEVGDSTKQLQRDILKDLDSLIEENKRQQQDQDQAQDQDQQQGQQGQDKQGQQQANGPGSKTGQRRQQANGGRRGSGRTRTARGRGQGSAQQAMDQQGQGGNSKSTEGGAGGSGKGPDELNRLAEVYKDIWGELPKSLRQEMDAYNREEFMTKYKDVLKQYYATVAEKGRHKD
jgi:hypothetical protein